MTILVAGAHGPTGQHVTRKLAERGHTVRAMIRDADQSVEMEALAEGRDGAVEPVVADLTDDPGHAADGCDAVVFAAGSSGNDVEGVDRDGAIRLIDACVERGTGRFVMLSAIRADVPEDWPEALRPYMRAKHAADEYLRESGLPYAIVQPGTLSDDDEEGTVTAAEDIGHREGEITRADVAEALVLALQEPNVANRSVELLPGDTPTAEALRTF